MQKQVFSLGCFVLLSIILPPEALALSTSSNPQNFDNIYVFGDSLSDDGNAFNYTSGQVPPSPPYYQGRFSNGPVWVEDLAVDLGLTPNPLTNFAVGGATTGSTNTINSNLPGLQQEISTFTTVNSTADPSSLYVIWAGANDFLGGNVTDPTIPINNLSTAVTSLANVGAKNIMVVNLPNLGSTPGTNTNSQISNSLNTLTAVFNSELATSLNSLGKSENINIVDLDINSFENNIINNPTPYGFTNVTQSCLDTSNLTVCSNPSSYLFWDSLHPTSAANQLIGNFAYTTLTSIPVPFESSSAVGVFSFTGVYAILGLWKKTFSS